MALRNSMTFYAHTATRPDGSPDPNESNWQPLAQHLRNVARLAKEFAAPLGLGDEAELAGMLHDLGKYAVRFQDRLRNPRIHGINHWSMGASASFAHRALEAAFAIEGHHTGMPALHENDGESGLESAKERLLKVRGPKHAPR
jgi:CRISPR-associated endonuclease/helicase Cas3